MMPLLELKYMMVGLIVIDAAIVIALILLIRRFRYLSGGLSFSKEIELFESLVSDADRMAGEFKDQLAEKSSLAQRLNSKLDKRIASLTVLLKRADAMLSATPVKEAGDDPEPDPWGAQQTRILAMEKQGRGIEEIAESLGIPKGEVQLVVDLSKRLAEIHGKEGAS